MKSSAPFFSVVLATYNEAHNLERCLKAVQSISDEVIVVDGSSPDGTAQLAQKLGAKVIKTTNKPIFHINKQMAMDAAKGTLVLQLDADEVIDSECLSWMKTLKKKLQQTTVKEWVKNGNPVAWWIRRKNYFLGTFLTKGGQYPDPTIRLYLNGYARLPQQDVHEQMSVDGPTDTAEGHMLHYANPTFDVYLRKFNTYTSLKATQLRDAGVTPGFWSGMKYIVYLPFATFFSLSLRHKGIIDGIPGLAFALLSGLHHAAAYLKLWELTQTKKQ